MKKKRMAFSHYYRVRRMERRLKEQLTSRNASIPFMEELERKAKAGDMFALRKLAKHRRKV